MENPLFILQKKTCVCYYNGKTFTNFTIAPPGNSYSQSPKKVAGILHDKKGNFWFVTLNHGVYRYDGKSFTNYLPIKRWYVF